MADESRHPGALTPSPTELGAFCLRGPVDGMDRTFPLGSGEHLVGSSRTAAVRLPVPGVSRRHALIRIEDQSVTVVDLGSKNGTRVDAVSVPRLEAGPVGGLEEERPADASEGDAFHRVEIGQELRFGPVKLRLRTLDLADALLGIDLEESTDGPSDRPRTGSRGLRSRSFRADTSLLESDDDPLAAIYPALLATLVEYLTLPSPELSAATRMLADALPVTAAAFVEWRGDSASVIACSAADPDLFSDLDGRLPEGLGSSRMANSVLPGPDESRSFGLGQLVGVVRIENGSGAPRGGFALLVRPEDGVEAPLALLSAILRIVCRIGTESVAEPETGSVPAVDSAAERLRFPAGILAGRSPTMLELYQQMRMLLQGDLPVLVLGETGVGKEHLASTLHRSSRRADGPFVAVNCAAIPAELLEAEMFGIGKGVATGVEARDGEISRADGGTLFLDEVGEIPLPLQAKLLRVLQEQRVRPLGRQARDVDIRVVAATNADLHQRISEGSFRSDLYFRLAGYELEVPPLRRRAEDLPPLVAEFLRRFGKETGKRVRGVSVKALTSLAAYDWPGNIRELEHEIRRLVYRCPAGQAIDSSMLSDRIRRGPRDDADLEVLPTADSDAAETAPGTTMGLEERVDALQKRLIHRALVATGGNQTRAAKLLRVSRSGLIKRMKRLEIDSEASASG